MGGAPPLRGWRRSGLAGGPARAVWARQAGGQSAEPGVLLWLDGRYEGWGPRRGGVSARDAAPAIALAGCDPRAMGLLRLGFLPEEEGG